MVILGKRSRDFSPNLLDFPKKHVLLCKVQAVFSGSIGLGHSGTQTTIINCDDFTLYLSLVLLEREIKGYWRKLEQLVS